MLKGELTGKVQQDNTCEPPEPESQVAWSHEFQAPAVAPATDQSWAAEQASIPSLGRLPTTMNRFPVFRIAPPGQSLRTWFLSGTVIDRCLGPHKQANRTGSLLLVPSRRS